jgi:hypothetical protein
MNVVAKRPIDWVEFQFIMSTLGYDGLSKSGDCARLFGGDRSLGRPPSITVLLPTFVGITGKVDSYEAEYVADVVDHALGGTGEGHKVVAKFIAERRLES